LGVGTILWALIPALSLGFLAPVPFAHAAVRLRQRRLWAVTAAYAIGVVVLFTFSASREGSWGDAVFGTALFALMIVGTIHAFVLRGRVFAPLPPAQPALAASKRREEARAIATRDVALARELRIGRPELPRQFDDGGLVDVNHVPARVLVDWLGLSPVQAGQVVETRERLGGFASPEEFIGCSELSEATANTLRDRLLFLADDVDGSALPESAHMPVDDHDERPKTTAPENGKGLPPSGWYPNPQGGLGLRWWDGARWSDQVRAPTTPPRKHTASQQLNRAFGIEVPCTLLSFGVAWLTLFGVAGCSGTLGSDPQCQVWGWSWLVLVAAHLVLLVVCGALFVVGVRTKRVALKRWAVMVLPSGIAAAWTLFIAVVSLTGA